MKKFLMPLFVFCLSCELFAGEWNFNSTLGLQLTPKNKSKTVYTEGENYFAEISGINVPAPYGQFVTNYKIPLNFGESIVFQDANVTFSIELNLTPVTYENQFIIYFSPSPVLTFSLESVAGTGWTLFGNSGLAKYNGLTDSYDALTPFKDWKYSFACKSEFQFDFGFLIPGEWTHVLTKASYTVRYEACSEAKDYELWSVIGSETVNGLKYSATFVLGYILPFKLNMIAVAANIKGYFFYSDFVEISFALQSVVKLSEKNELRIGAVIPGRKNHSLKNVSAREWYFNGVSIEWKHVF